MPLADKQLLKAAFNAAAIVTENQRKESLILSRHCPGVAATVLPDGPSRWIETEGPWLFSIDKQLRTCIQSFEFTMVRALLRMRRSLRTAAKLLRPKIEHSWSPTPQQDCNASIIYSSSTYII